MGYCGVLWGTVGYYGGTVGYCGVLWLLQGTGGTGGIGGTVGYWGVQGYLGVNRVVVDTLGYCRVLCELLVTPGYFWVLGGTGVH